MPTAPIPPEIASRYAEALDAGDVEGVLRAISDLRVGGNSRTCEAWLVEAWERFPAEPRLAVRLLEQHQRYRVWDAFDATAEVAFKRHPDDPDVHYVVGCGYEARGLWSKAARSFGEAVAHDPDEIEPALRQARALRIEQRREDAQAVLEALLKRHPDAAAAHAALGYMAIDQGDPEKAIARFRKAVEHQPDWTPYLDDLATALNLCDQWAEAARIAMRSLEHRKKNERAWSVLASASAKLGNATRADQAYKNAIRASKDPSRAQGNYGLFLAKDPARLLEAVRMLKTAHAAHPDWDEVGATLDGLLDT